MAASPGGSRAEAAEQRREGLLATLQQLEEEDDEAVMQRYREQTRLNKVAPGERKSLIERQSEKKGGALDHSEQRIKATEQATEALKTQRDKCQTAIDDDVAALELLEGHIAQVVRKLDAVKAGHRSRRRERDKLIALLDESKRKSALLVKECGFWHAKSRRDEHLRSRDFATQLLRAERGFSCEIGSTCTASQAHDRSIVAKRTSSVLSTASSRRGRGGVLSTSTSAVSLPQPRRLGQSHSAVSL